ncbi:MAG: hypothetical protein AAFO07_08080 [Bacteroidota bacterium]
MKGKPWILFTLIIFFGGNSLLAQRTISFTYGENYEYFGSVRVGLFLKGKRKADNQQIIRPLDRLAYTVRVKDYENPQLILRFQNLEFRQHEHCEGYGLNLDIREYSNLSTPGLTCANKMGSEIVKMVRCEPKMARREIIFDIDTSITEDLSGELSILCQILTSDNQLQIINSNHNLTYHLSVSSTEDLQKNSVKNSDSTSTRDEPVSSTKDVSKTSTYFGSKKEEELFSRFMDSNTLDEIITLGNEYLQKFPEGIYLEDVLSELVLSAQDNTIKQEMVNLYLEKFPEGKYATAFSDLLSSPTDSLMNTGWQNVNSLMVDMTLKGKELAIQDIENGEPPFSLLVYQTPDRNKAVFNVELGSARRFTVDLDQLPLRSGDYYLGLRDANQGVFYLKDPLQFGTAQVGWLSMLPWTRIGMALGSIMIAMVAIYVYSKRIRNY